MDEALLGRVQALVLADPSLGYRALHKRLQGELEFKHIGLKRVQAASRQVQEAMEQSRQTDDADEEPVDAGGSRRRLKRVKDALRYTGVVDDLVDSVMDGLLANDPQRQLAHLAYDGRLEDIKQLAPSQELINAEQGNGGRAIHEAAVGGHPNVVVWLLEHKADPNVRNLESEGVFPLAQAAAQGHTEVVQTLLAHKADVNRCDTRGRTAVSPAALRGHDGCLKALLDAHANPEGRTSGSEAPLSALGAASIHGRLCAARLLLERRADVSARWSRFANGSGGGQTPLHAAAMGGPDRGEDRTNETAAGRAKVWMLLVSHGASVNVKNHAGQTPSDIAKGDRSLQKELTQLRQRKDGTGSIGVTSQLGAGCKPESAAGRATEARELPAAAGPWRDVCEFFLDGDLLSAVVRGQTCDSAFLSHTIPGPLLRDIREARTRGAPGAPVLGVVEEIHRAATARQECEPSAGPMELANTSALVALCDAALAATPSEEQSSRSAALFLRGTLWKTLGDWPAAAADLRASYAASGGRAPWILRNVAWCTASNTDGLPAGTVLGNYRAAEGMYEELLVLLDPLAESDTVAGHVLVDFVFTLWELAQVLLWQFSILNPGFQSVWASMRSWLPFGWSSTDEPHRIAKLDEESARDLIRRASRFRRRALAAELRLEACGGDVVSCIAREAVLDTLPNLEARLLGGPAGAGEAGAGCPGAEAEKECPDVASQRAAVDPERNNPSRQVEPLVEPQAAASAAGAGASRCVQQTGPTQVQDALFECLNTKETDNARMPEEVTQAMLSMIEGRGAELMGHLQEAEGSMRERRAAYDLRETAVTVREARAQEREVELASRRADWEKAAAELQGQANALAERATQERQRQADKFRAQIARLAAERDEQVKALGAQLNEVEASYHDDLEDLRRINRDLHSELEHAFGAQDQAREDFSGWRQELKSREDMLVAQSAVLSDREEEARLLQERLQAEQARLEQQRDSLKKEQRALEQLEGSSAAFLPKSPNQARKVQTVRLHDLRFSQNNVGRCFRDGRRLEDTVRELRSGSLSPDALPRLRVVRYMDLLWSLDNRRLRCLKEAFLEHRNADMTITVQLEPLTDGKVAEEFQRKFTVGKTVEQRQPAGRR